ncbi:MAG TPA: hypothetical protein VM491_00950 [Burkholderiaceae bacterium]|nr:hypothetical protein [Burkholderiaceae bacterium]
MSDSKHRSGSVLARVRAAAARRTGSAGHEAAARAEQIGIDPRGGADRKTSGSRETPRDTDAPAPATRDGRRLNRNGAK